MKDVKDVQDLLKALKDSLKIEVGVDGNMLSNIPPITSTGRSRFDSKPPNFTPRKNGQNKYYKKPVTVNTPLFNNVLECKEVPLDVFNETDSELKVVGDFSGINGVSDIIVQIENNELFITTKHDSKKRYTASTKLPKAYKYKIFSMEVKNGIMMMVMEKVNYEDVPELESIFQECLNKFPELSYIGLRVIRSRRSSDRDSLDGAMGKANGEDVVILFVPNKLWGQWEVFRPIIYHELSHYLNLENPDKIFYERADEKSIKLWNMLKESNTVECKVDKI